MNTEDNGEDDKFKILYNGKYEYTAEAIVLLKELGERGYLVSPSHHDIKENVGLAVALINHTVRIIPKDEEKKEDKKSVGGNINVHVIYPGNKVKKSVFPATEPNEIVSPGSGDSILYVNTSAEC